MRRVYKSISSSLIVCIPGCCYTTSRPAAARECTSTPHRFFRRLTSSSPCASLLYHLVFSDGCILSLLQVTFHSRHPHPNIMPPDARSSAASSRYSDAPTTIHTIRYPDLAFRTGFETLSLPCPVDEMLKASGCKSVAQR
jgi:hypothetical protein